MCDLSLIRKCFSFVYHLVLKTPIKVVVTIFALALPTIALSESSVPSRGSEMVFGFAEYPPVGITNAQGNPDGYLFRLAEAAIKKLGYQPRLRILPTTRIEESLKDGSVNFTILGNSPKREAFCAVGKLPIFVDELRAIHLSSVPNIKNVQDLAGKRIIRMAGYGYGGVLDFLSNKETKTTVEEASTREAGLEMMLNGRADYFMDYAGPVAGALSQLNNPNIRAETVYKLDFVVLGAPKNAEGQKMVEQIEKTLKELQTLPQFKMPKM
ncbi:transporter substrate-binding domain-containing protein [Undibacterium jejuense]|uniref:Transporter substrate-binding domain-containing protein n=1 Tax=Undibacterium jejuense TaxID=1344949 RepID=A0A923HLK2_9BURK|nr:transporter substrate-binding domain-containing protein [Undibacterium jejuense]MBC3863119.1 transporter substrate-binding domain-containing protein [Undibacterium jejuense]